MARFEIAFEYTDGHEGGYVDDPDDPGGETYRGVSRVYWPEWEGWLLIDAMKSAGKRPIKGQNAVIDNLVFYFYKERFWDVFEGDKIPDQNIANELYDTGVNMATTRAIRFLQEALNLANRNGKWWDDIKEDGKWGPTTYGTLRKAFDRGEENKIYKIMNILQGEFYINKMRANPAKEKWIGWFNRVTISK